MNTLEFQIRSTIQDLLAEKMSLDDFQQWFAYEMIDILTDSEAHHEPLAYQVEAYLAEYTGGHRSESSLRERLRYLVEHYSFSEDRLERIYSNTSSPSVVVFSASSVGNSQSKAHV